MQAEIETQSSQKVVDAIQGFYNFFANQEPVFYTLILLFVAIFSVTCFYLLKMPQLMRKCYAHIDHKGFYKINFLNLISVLFVSQIKSSEILIVNILCCIYVLPLLMYFKFMFKLFVLNIKQYQSRKGFVKNKKQQSENEKMMGMGNRISNNDLNAVYQSASEMYRDCQPKIVDTVKADLQKNRLNAETLEERKENS